MPRVENSGAGGAHERQVVFPLGETSRIAEGADWHLPVSEAEACIRVEQMDPDQGQSSTTVSLIAGGIREVVEAYTRLVETTPLTTAAVDVLHLGSYALNGPAANLLQTWLADASAGPSRYRPERTAVYASMLEQQMRAMPVADTAVGTAQSLVEGHPVSPDSIDAMNRAFLDPVVRSLVSERGVSTVAVARELESLGVAEVEAMVEGWNAALFGPAPPGCPTDPVVIGDLDDVHSAITWITGMHPESDRMPNPHNTGGCAAFAVVLNRALGGGGHYLLSGNPEVDFCSHVALRVGDHILDAQGVHDPDDFYRKWGTAGGMVQFYDPSPDGDLVRGFAYQKLAIDEEGLAEDIRVLREALNLSAEINLLEAGPSPGMR